MSCRRPVALPEWLEELRGLADLGELLGRERAAAALRLVIPHAEQSSLFARFASATFERVLEIIAGHQTGKSTTAQRRVPDLGRRR